MNKTIFERCEDMEIKTIQDLVDEFQEKLFCGNEDFTSIIYEGCTKDEFTNKCMDCINTDGTVQAGTFFGTLLETLEKEYAR